MLLGFGHYIILLCFISYFIFQKAQNNRFIKLAMLAKIL